LEDGSFQTKEQIKVNFSEARHGIYRTIPIGGDFPIELDHFKAVGDNYQRSKNKNKVRLQIGDADKTIVGDKNYTIQYTVFGAVRIFTGYQELYWNIV